MVASYTTVCRFYRYPNNNIEDVMQMMQAVSAKHNTKLRWCMDTENGFGIEVFDSVTQRWLISKAVFTADTEIKKEDVERHVEGLLSSRRREPQITAKVVAQHPAVIDFSKQPNAVQMAKEQLSKLFPHLQLQLVHTSGEDLQSRRTHTVSVSLIHRSGSLSPAEKRALSLFEAEAMGPGFLRTARRALAEAFEKCGLVFATDSVVPSRSVLGSYVDLLRALSDDVSVLVSHKSSNAVVQVKVDNELCGSVTCEGSVKPEDLMTALKHAVDLKCPQEGQQLRISVDAHPLILVLPQQRIRVKRVLRELLQYYYGMAEEDVLFVTHQNVQGVAACAIETALPLSALGLRGKCEKITLASASGLSKSAAEQLAAVLALQAHFPKEYLEQISFHAEVAEILQSRKASAHPDFPPPASKGLKNLLDWALSRSSVQVKLTPLLLQANKRYECFGVQPTANVWSTTVDVKSAGDAKTFVVYDQKKNRCENKAVALTLVSYFSDMCPDGIAFAKEKGFLTEAGTVATCAALLPLSGNGGVGAEDKLMSSLQVVPWQIMKRPSEEEGPCLLERLRVAAGRQRDVRTVDPPLEERTLHDAVKEVYVASLVKQSGDEEKVVCTFVHKNELRCLLSLYVCFAKEQDSMDKGFVCNVPFALPRDAPLEVMAALIHRLYGLQVAVRLTMTHSIHYVELWGVDGEGEQAKRWVLGKSKGASFHGAVRSCCVECFETHVRHLHPPFEGVPCDVADIVLAIQQHSVLSKLMRRVQTEIEQTSTEKNLSVLLKLTANRALSIPFLVHMDAVSDVHSIVLEKCSGSSLLAALEKLRVNIATETETEEKPAKELRATNTSGVSVAERLKERCETLPGLTLLVETLFYDKKWVSRISVQLNETYRYALCISESQNKKQSVENACMKVLSTHFGEPVYNMFSSEPSVHECNYVYSHIPIIT